MYRVYDTVDKKWIENGIYMSPDGDLYLLSNENKFIFNSTKLTPLINDGRYVCQKYIELTDNTNGLIYEGDYLEAQISEDKTVKGVVAYAHELSSYIILCIDYDEFYTLGSEVCKYIEIIGNVFDGYLE